MNHKSWVVNSNPARNKRISIYQEHDPSSQVLCHLGHTLFQSWDSKVFLSYHLKMLTNGTSELELTVQDLWITNQILDPTNKKFVKLPTFTDCFSKIWLKIISTDDICLSIFLELIELSWMMKEQNSVNYAIIH